MFRVLGVLGLRVHSEKRFYNEAVGFGVVQGSGNPRDSRHRIPCTGEQVKPYIYIYIHIFKSINT